MPRLSHSAFFHLRRRSLLRGNLIVLASLLVSFPLVGFPAGRRNPLLIFPALTALYGTFETVRCVRPERDLYHAGVILFLWMDSMAVCLILVFLLAPFIF